MNINKEMITDISGVNPRKCMKCGKCSATCPAFDAMDYHPHQFVDMVENGRIEALMQSKSHLELLKLHGMCTEMSKKR